jgi:hypothetical protein
VPLARDVVPTADKEKREARAAAADLENRQKLWRWALLAVLAVLLIEIIVAGRLSRTVTA